MVYWEVCQRRRQLQLALRLAFFDLRLRILFGGLGEHPQEQLLVILFKARTLVEEALAGAVRLSFCQTQRIVSLLKGVEDRSSLATTAHSR